MPQIKINKVRVSDAGDPTVGIPGDLLELNFNGLPIREDDLRALRLELQQLFNNWFGETGTVEFDFEHEEEVAYYEVRQLDKEFQRQFAAGAFDENLPHSLRIN